MKWQRVLVVSLGLALTLFGIIAIANRQLDRRGELDYEREMARLANAYDQSVDAARRKGLNPVQQAGERDR